VVCACGRGEEAIVASVIANAAPSHSFERRRLHRRWDRRRRGRRRRGQHPRLRARLRGGLPRYCYVLSYSILHCYTQFYIIVCDHLLLLVPNGSLNPAPDQAPGGVPGRVHNVAPNQAPNQAPDGDQAPDRLPNQLPDQVPNGEPYHLPQSSTRPSTRPSVTNQVPVREPDGLLVFIVSFHTF
jgi:hypothetical protein